MAYLIIPKCVIETLKLTIETYYEKNDELKKILETV